MARAFSDSTVRLLAIDAERAGAAMACRYSSSDEYEAALIAERRAAGAYHRLRRDRLVLWSAVAAAALLSVVMSF
jgi:hypothetical protein